MRIVSSSNSTRYDELQTRRHISDMLVLTEKKENNRNIFDEKYSAIMFHQTSVLFQMLECLRCAIFPVNVYGMEYLESQYQQFMEGHCPLFKLLELFSGGWLVACMEEWHTNVGMRSDYKKIMAHDDKEAQIIDFLKMLAQIPYGDERRMYISPEDVKRIFGTGSQEEIEMSGILEKSGDVFRILANRLSGRAGEQWKRALFDLYWYLNKESGSCFKKSTKKRKNMQCVLEQFWEWFDRSVLPHGTLYQEIQEYFEGELEQNRGMEFTICFTACARLAARNKENGRKLLTLYRIYMERALREDLLQSQIT